MQSKVVIYKINTDGPTANPMRGRIECTLCPWKKGGLDSWMHHFAKEHTEIFAMVKLGALRPMKEYASAIVDVPPFIVKAIRGPRSLWQREGVGYAGYE